MNVWNVYKAGSSILLCLLIFLKPLFLYVHRFIPAFSSSNSSVRSYGWSYNGAKISHIPGICFLQDGLFWFGAKYRKMWLKQRKYRFMFQCGHTRYTVQLKTLSALEGFPNFQQKDLFINKC